MMRSALNRVLCILLLAIASFFTTTFGQEAREMDLLVMKSEDGANLSNAKVIVNLGDKELEFRSDINGHVMLPLPEANTLYFLVQVEHTSYVKKILQWLPDPKRSIPSKYELKLDNGISIGGKITDDIGAPIRGARIVLSIPMEKSNPGSIEHNQVSYETVTSGENGIWTFAGAQRGFETVQIGVWDYAYASGEFFQFKEFKAAEAIDRSISLLLPRGVPIEGVVLGSDSKPLAGARVMYGGQMASNKMDPQLTDVDGKFHYAAKQGESVVLTVTASGHSPELSTFKMGEEKEEPKISLGKSTPMVGRIVGPENEPVPFAWVYPDTWRGTRSLESRIQADKNGKFRWEDAPSDAVVFHIDGIAAGYVREELSLTAQKEELIIPLRKALRVSGTVVDAANGKPIDSFRVIRGIVFGRGQMPDWQRNDKSISRKGKFEYTEGWVYPGYAVRIEADGYLPDEVSGFYLEDEEVKFDIELTKAENINTKIVNSDGTPAAKAKGYLLPAESQQGLSIYNGKANNHSFDEATSDADGNIQFPPQFAGYKIVVLCEAGFAEVNKESIEDANEITLQDWGKLDGTLTLNDKPWPDANIDITRQSNGQPNFPSVHILFQIKTDLNGKFTIDRIPEGNFTVASRIEKQANGGAIRVNNMASKRVTIIEGESSKVELEVEIKDPKE